MYGVLLTYTHFLLPGRDRLHVTCTCACGSLSLFAKGVLGLLVLSNVLMFGSFTEIYESERGPPSEHSKRLKRALK